MKRKVEFDSITELQETYPIGFLVKRKYDITCHERYFYNSRDYNFLKRTYDTVIVTGDNVAQCRKEEIRDDVVEGYIFNGRHWQPAYNTWDGWCPYDEDDFQ